MVFLLWLLAYVWGSWGLYVIVMAVYRMHLMKKLSPPSYILAAPFALLGFALDVLGNGTLCWLLFLDAPREWTITGRLQRYMAQPAGWRRETAKWVCANALDPFDARDGDHC